MKIKHNKIKNVGVLFELLTRQITSDTINGVKKSPAIQIVKEYFNKNSYLLKEYNLYKALQQQKYKTDVKAEKFLDLVLQEFSKISRAKLKREKYNLIKEIKSHYNLEDFFKSRVSNYRINASIYTLLESSNSSAILNPSTIMKCRIGILEHITNKQIGNKTRQTIIKEYSKQDKDLRLLSYKILLEKFNTKYGKLGKQQQRVLREYINNISNTSTLKKYIVNEIHLINTVLKLLTEKVTDNIVKIKLQEVQQQLNLIPEDNKVREKHLVSLMRSYDLIKELRNVAK